MTLQTPIQDEANHIIDSPEVGRTAVTPQREDEPQSEAGLRITEAEYWDKYYEHPYFKYEWNNGILEEKPVSDIEQLSAYRWFLRLLETYLDAYPIATILMLETAFRMALPGKTAIRKPDLFIVHQDNPVQFLSGEFSYHGTADLCVELISDSKPSEIERDTVVKKREYELAGVHEYYIFDIHRNHMAFYQNPSSGLFEPIPAPDGVIRCGVLPGLNFRIEHLYDPPPLTSLIDDPVYKPYVMREYQAIRQQVEQERQRAEQEQHRAEQQHQRADKLAAKLRELGIDENDL